MTVLSCLCWCCFSLCRCDFHTQNAIANRKRKYLKFKESLELCVCVRFFCFVLFWENHTDKRLFKSCIFEKEVTNIIVIDNWSTFAKSFFFHTNEIHKFSIRLTDRIKFYGHGRFRIWIGTFAITSIGSIFAGGQWSQWSIAHTTTISFTGLYGILQYICAARIALKSINCNIENGVWHSVRNWWPMKNKKYEKNKKNYRLILKHCALDWLHW